MANDKQLKRGDVDESLKWKLEDIYKTDKDWEADFKKLEKMMGEIPVIKKNLTKSAADLCKSLVKIEELEHIASYLFVYARMRRDEDNADPKYQAMTSKAMDINVKLSSALSFVNPTLLALDDGVLQSYIDKARREAKSGAKKSILKLLNFDFMLEELIRYKPHVLSKKQEKILSMTGEMQSAPKDIYTMLNNADMKFGEVKDENGDEVTLTHGSYIVLMQSPSREVRKDAFEKMYGAYAGMINTISAAYTASVKKDNFNAKVRKFGSALERALFSDNAPVQLYDNLIRKVHDNLDTMYEYVELRRSLLKVDELHMYDIYAPLTGEDRKNYSFSEGMKMIKAALKVLGGDYSSLLDRAATARWIDVVETQGKTSGAYSWGVYGVHPYVLLNHRGDLDSVYTIAHELGHAMHTYYSNAMQPEAKANYTIFVAEVASTVNEILLTKHLLNQIDSKQQRAVILNHYLDQFRTTVLRQTMFAEFEKITHKQQQDGEPLTYASMCELYGELNELYHGPKMALDKEITYEWARIPHFYNAFYVYKYATGFSCAVTIAKNLLSGNRNAVADYIKFLSSGGSNHPLELLKIAGVDLISGEPVDVCMKEFKNTLMEFEKTI